MQVSRWGNSLALRLPAAVVETLGLKEGDDIQVVVAGARVLEVKKGAGCPRNSEALAEIPRSSARRLFIRPA
jgi:antitoxin MazE